VDSGDSEDTLPLALDLGSIRRDENQDVLPVTTAKTLTQKFSVQRGSTVRKDQKREPRVRLELTLDVGKQFAKRVPTVIFARRPEQAQLSREQSVLRNAQTEITVLLAQLPASHVRRGTIATMKILHISNQ